MQCQLFLSETTTTKWEKEKEKEKVNTRFPLIVVSALVRSKWVIKQKQKQKQRKKGKRFIASKHLNIQK